MKKTRARKVLRRKKRIGRKKQIYRKKTRARVKTRKIKSYTLPINTKVKTRFEVYSDEFIQFRDRFGRVRKSPSGNLRVYAEIRKRKSKKLVAYANYIKGGKVEPRRFKPSYRKFLQARIESPKIRPVSTEIHEFSIDTSDTVLEQIRSQAHEAIEAIWEKTQEDGFCIFRMKMELKDASPISNIINIHAGTRKNDIGYIIGSEILRTISETNMRLSPKAIANQPRKLHRRSIKVFLQILEAGEL